ncbi:MAG: manganese efflux pump MntP family protein [Bacilli bacterium]
MNSFIALQEVGTVTLLGAALSMDAFSVGIGLGTLRLRFRQMFYIGCLIGLFHMMMPLLGMSIGDWLAHHYAPVAPFIAGFVLLALGGNILFSTLITKEDRNYSVGGVGLLIFGIIVSLDSFSVGMTLGIYHMPVPIVLAIFGAMAALFMWTGLYIGHLAKKSIGMFAEIVGGIVLLAIGIALLLG